MQVPYSNVKSGDKLLVQSDNSKVKRESIVKIVESYLTKTQDVMVKLAMEDGEIFYGWANRFCEKLS